MKELTPTASTHSRDVKEAATETISDSEKDSSKAYDAAPTLTVPPASFSYFPYCSVTFPLAFATDAISSLSSCLFSSRWSMTCNGSKLSPADIGFNPDRHHHQRQQRQQKQLQQGYSNNPAMSWAPDRKPYIHTPTHAASGFLTTSTANHMKKAQQDKAITG